MLAGARSAARGAGAASFGKRRWGRGGVGIGLGTVYIHRRKYYMIKSSSTKASCYRTSHPASHVETCCGAHPKWGGAMESRPLLTMYAPGCSTSGFPPWVLVGTCWLCRSMSIVCARRQRQQHPGGGK